METSEIVAKVVAHLEKHPSYPLVVQMKSLADRTETLAKDADQLAKDIEQLKHDIVVFFAPKEINE